MNTSQSNSYFIELLALPTRKGKMFIIAMTKNGCNQYQIPALETKMEYN